MSDDILQCAHCGEPVLPESMVKVGDRAFHRECVWNAASLGREEVRHPRIFTMRSNWSNKITEMVIWMTNKQFAELHDENRRKIQEILPEATAEEREFLISGMSPAEQHELFGGEE